MTDTLLGNLVRVVARDGSVWWVQPESVDYYRSIQRVPDAVLLKFPGLSSDDVWNRAHRTQKGA